MHIPYLPVLYLKKIRKVTIEIISILSCILDIFVLNKSFATYISPLGLFQNINLVQLNSQKRRITIECNYRQTMIEQLYGQTEK